ncbi:MAG: hypothetical protein JNJ42_08275 [Burkholderiaceae bacterium]|nr:hypothetical protein [Burkholderiaceae bacterium]
MNLIRRACLVGLLVFSLSAQALASAAATICGSILRDGAPGATIASHRAGDSAVDNHDAHAHHNASGLSMQTTEVPLGTPSAVAPGGQGSAGGDGCCACLSGGAMAPMPGPATGVAGSEDGSAVFVTEIAPIAAFVVDRPDRPPRSDRP